MEKSDLNDEDLLTIIFLHDVTNGGKYASKCVDYRYTYTDGYRPPSLDYNSEEDNFISEYGESVEGRLRRLEKMGLVRKRRYLNSFSWNLTDKGKLLCKAVLGIIGHPKAK